MPVKTPPWKLLCNYNYFWYPPERECQVQSPFRKPEERQGWALFMCLARPGHLLIRTCG